MHEAITPDASLPILKQCGMDRGEHKMNNTRNLAIAQHKARLVHRNRRIIHRREGLALNGWHRYYFYQRGAR